MNFIVDKFRISCGKCADGYSQMNLASVWRSVIEQTDLSDKNK
jgi:hypothetical protein